MKNNNHPIEIFLDLNTFVDVEKILWIQGAGGNTSFKSENKLYIKASGTRISDLKSIESLAQLDFIHLRKSLEEIFQGDQVSDSQWTELSYKKAIEASSAQNSLRPSMESGFHAWLPQKFVFHLHSLISLCLAELIAQERLSGSNEFQNWYRDFWQSTLGSWKLIDCCLPGFELTKLMAETPSSSLYFLRNHGVVFAFDQPEELISFRTFEFEVLKKFFMNSYSQIISWKLKNADQLLNEFPELLEAELKFYFPDMAIMYPRIQKYLLPLKNGKFQFRLENNTNVPEKNNPLDKDALENWLANSMLQKIKSDLPELPPTLCEKIPNLPTEIARKKVMET